MHLTAKFHHHLLNRVEVIVLTNKHKLTNKQTNRRRRKHSPRFATLRRWVKINKCLTVAEMDDRLATIDMGQKLGGAMPPFWGWELGPHLTQYGLGRGLPPHQMTS